MSLYDDLGVGKNADASEMKRAYRKKASKAHPDKGGTPEAFQQLQHAYALLSDPARRQRYDSTGHEHELPPIEAAAKQQLGGIIIGLVEQGEPNILLKASEIIHVGQQNGRKGVEQLKSKIARVEKSLTKLKRKNPGHDFLREAIEQLLQNHRASLENAENAVLLGAEMNRLLKQYEYEVTIEQYDVQDPGSWIAVPPSFFYSR